MQPAKLWIVLALSVMSPCLTHGQKASGSETGLEGVISISPIQAGPLRAGAPESRPFSGAAFVVKGEHGLTDSFTTDEQGHFQISLAPGHYSVSLKGEKPAIGHFGPFEADVVAGQMKKVQWECDAGTR